MWAFGLHFGGQNPSKIDKKCNQILDQFLEGIFDGFWWILELFLELFLIKMAIKVEKGDFMKNLWKPLGKPYFLKVWGMLWEAKIDQKKASETVWILEGIFD